VSSVRLLQKLEILEKNGRRGQVNGRRTTPGRDDTLILTSEKILETPPGDKDLLSVMAAQASSGEPGRDRSTNKGRK